MRRIYLEILWWSFLVGIMILTILFLNLEQVKSDNEKFVILVFLSSVLFFHIVFRGAWIPNSKQESNK